MVTRIHSKNIIGDFHIDEFLNKKKQNDIGKIMRCLLCSNNMYFIKYW